MTTGLLFINIYCVAGILLSILYCQFLNSTIVLQNYRGGDGDLGTLSPLLKVILLSDWQNQDFVSLFGSKVHGFPLLTYFLDFSFTCVTS